MTNAHKVPSGYHSLQPYLMFTNCDEAIAFFSKAFGAKEKLRMKDGKGRIAHAELEIGDSVMMMADEHPEIQAFAAAHYGGSPISLMLYVDNCDATYATALAAGATSLREPTDQPYGDRMAGVLDPFGYKWWLAHPIAQALAKESEAAQ
jgi:PhnB protein